MENTHALLSQTENIDKRKVCLAHLARFRKHRRHQHRLDSYNISQNGLPNI